ncbi:hypothetical protein P9X48_10910 [Bacillus cereus]|nr:hypothetical protein [Bacillus cereus]MEC2994403.1 hypothetical protein [Bacillus cereus]
MPLKQFKEILEKGAIPIGQSDILGKSLRQFDEIQYENETYLIIGVCVAMEPDHAISISGHYQRKKRKFL